MDPIPCFYSTPPGFIDPECSDNGHARYEWTYLRRLLGLDISGKQVEIVLAEDLDLPDYFVCTKHCADWRQQSATLEWHRSYSVKSLVWQ